MPLPRPPGFRPSGASIMRAGADRRDANSVGGGGTAPRANVRYEVSNVRGALGRPFPRSFRGVVDRPPEQLISGEAPGPGSDGGALLGLFGDWGAFVSGFFLGLRSLPRWGGCGEVGIISVLVGNFRCANGLVNESEVSIVVSCMNLMEIVVMSGLGIFYFLWAGCRW